MAWIGLSVAASSLVGQCIGAGDTRGARKAAVVTVVIGMGLALSIGGVCASFATPIARAFTNVGGIEMLTARLLPLIGVVMVLDAGSNTLGGVCSGLGLQRVAACAQLIGYYAIGLPVALAFAFWYAHGSRDGVFWLWGGVGLAMLSAAAIQLVALLRHDWTKSAEEASVRLARGAADEAAQARRSGGGSSSTTDHGGARGGAVVRSATAVAAVGAGSAFMSPLLAPGERESCCSDTGPASMRVN